jgi:hypothetical protein
MADTPSIIEFSEDVATAEAPPPLPVGQYPQKFGVQSVRLAQQW